jgi:hypothetical protein
MMQQDASLLFQIREGAEWFSASLEGFLEESHLSFYYTLQSPGIWPSECTKEMEATHHIQDFPKSRDSKLFFSKWISFTVTSEMGSG